MWALRSEFSLPAPISSSALEKYSAVDNGEMSPVYKNDVD
jgi:hypothetical protein